MTENLFQEPAIENATPVVPDDADDWETAVVSRLNILEGKIETIIMRQDDHSRAVNQIGLMLDHIVQTVTQFGQMFAGGNGLSTMMNMLKGGKSDG